MSDSEKPKSTSLVFLSNALVCFLAVSATTALLCRISSGVSLGVVPFLIWAIFPYVLVAGVAWQFRKATSSSIIMLVGTILLSVFGVYVLLDVFVFSQHHRSTEGLIVIFIPFYQIIGILLLSGGAYLLRRREGGKT